MSIETIIFSNMFGIILLGVLLSCSSLARKTMERENKIFLLMVLITMLGALFEMVSFLVDGKVFWGARYLNIFCNSYVYISNIIYPAVWLIYVEWKLYKNEEKFKMTCIWVSLPSLFLIGTLIGNVSGEYYFSVSQDNVYSRGPLCMAVLGFPYLYMLFSVALVHFGKKAQRCLFFPIVIFIAPVLFGGIVQLTNFGTSVIWTSLAIGLVAVYISKQKEITYTDALSKIYNRKYMSFVLQQNSNHKTPCAGIMIDVDKFKAINDKFGHTVGDQAITDTGAVLMESIPQDAVATRFAGDEFVVILKTQKLTEVMDVIDEINYRLKKFNATNQRPYKLSFSIGYSIFVPGVNTVEQFIDEMDKDMYNVKKKKKVYDFHTA